MPLQTTTASSAGSLADRVYTGLKRVPLWALALIWLLPSTLFIANLAADFSNTQGFLSAGAFVQAFIPVCVFFGLQRFFVRGLLAGSING